MHIADNKRNQGRTAAVTAAITARSQAAAATITPNYSKKKKISTSEKKFVAKGASVSAKQSHTKLKANCTWRCTHTYKYICVHTYICLSGGC